MIDSKFGIMVLIALFIGFGSGYAILSSNRGYERATTSPAYYSILPPQAAAGTPQAPVVREIHVHRLDDSEATRSTSHEPTGQPQHVCTSADFVRDAKGMTIGQLQVVAQILSLMNCGRPAGPNSQFPAEEFFHGPVFQGMSLGAAMIVARTTAIARCGPAFVATADAAFGKP